MARAAAAKDTVTWADVASVAQSASQRNRKSEAGADAAGVAVGSLLALLRARGSLEQGMVRAWRGAELTLPDDAALRVSAEEALHSHHHKVTQLKDKLAAAERAAAAATAEVRVASTPSFLEVGVRGALAGVSTRAQPGCHIRGAPLAAARKLHSLTYSPRKLSYCAQAQAIWDAAKFHSPAMEPFFGD